MSFPVSRPASLLLEFLVVLDQTAHDQDTYLSLGGKTTRDWPCAYFSICAMTVSLRSPQLFLEDYWNRQAEIQQCLLPIP
jgi:hypothetical protein